MKRRGIIATIVCVLGMMTAQAQINTDQVMRIGRNSLYFEDYVLSIQYFNQVIKAKPFLAEPYFYRGIAKINLEDFKGAEEDATLAIERNPFIVDAYQVRGIARQNQHNYQGAIEDYTEGLKLMPEEKVFLLNRAVCQDEIGEYDAAQESYDALLRLDSKNDRAYLGLAHLNLSRKDTARALEDITRSLELSKKNANSYVLRAEILMRHKEDYAAALADMDEAIKLEPHYAGYFINRAFMKYKLDDYFGAMADYDYAISLNPSTMEGHFNRGLLLAEVGENNKAIDDFSYVLKGQPDNFMALYNRAMLYFNTGQYRKAIADYDKVLEKYPKFEAGYMARGEAKRKMGDARGGNADYDRALAIFKSKKTKVSDFNPAQIEADAARHRAEQRAQTGEQEPESDDEIMNRFNTLLTVAPENPIKPEYANKQRGRIQNSNVEVTPEPLYLLTYYAHDNKLNGNTAYVKEISDLNDLRILPSTLTLTSDTHSLTEEQINRRFASIDYYNGLLSTSTPRAVDYIARAIDYLLVKNPDAALADADRAIAINGDYSLSYFLRANAHYLKWQMTRAGAMQDVATTSDATTQSMLHRTEETEELKKAQADFDMVIKLSPRNTYAIYNKGNVCLQLGDNTGAISCYNQVLELRPDFAEAYYNRGLVYLRMGNKERGVADLSKAGELGILPSYNVLKRMN
ncbi:MAG: tetratricopeptide repeat protein [Muribaculaceae bacterium]|nr:tetratricopeptide repeat protein [Muribaculaceae bacterium]